ncbi:hypothetical protein MTO96_018545 [Rhipicephalus appendiculatus]
MLSTTMPERNQWRSEDEFFFATAGMCMGLSNLWRFPSSVYQNGGLVFILVYVLLMAVIGLPMMYLELFLGQFTSLTVPRAFGGFPLAKGIGWVMLYFILVSCPAIMSTAVHGVFYLYYSFSSTLPWTSCKQQWTDSQCYEMDYRNIPCMSINATLSRKYASQNYSEKDALAIQTDGGRTVMVPGTGVQCHAQHLPQRHADLDRAVPAPSAGSPGFLTVSKGIRSYAKVSMFCSCASYVLIFMLFLASAVQRGSMLGLHAYFRTEWEKLTDVMTWRTAMQQMLFSLSLALGSITCYGSYKNFTWYLLPNIVKLMATDFIFSVLAGCVALSLSGHATILYGIELQDAVASGYDYAFVAYPESVKHFGHAELWCIAFFLLLCILSFGGGSGALFTTMSAFEDMYPSMRERRTLFTLGVCTVFFVISLPTATGEGLYLLNLIDSIIYLDLLPWVALAEVTLVVHGYGMVRLSHDILFMTGQLPSAYFSICWRYVCPLALMIASLGTVTAKRTELFAYRYPEWSGLIKLAVILCCIFAVSTQILRIFAENNNDIYAALEPEEQYGPANRVTWTQYHEEMAARNVLLPVVISRTRSNPTATASLSPSKPLRVGAVN